MADDHPRYCWDACIFYEHFRTLEPAEEIKRQAIRKILMGNERRENTIFTSSITHLEVVPKKLTRDDDNAEKKYWALFGSKFFYEVPIDANVIKLARAIKDYYFKEGDPKTGSSYRIMDTGDSIHLATAIINEADEFHTRDNCKKKTKVPLLDLHQYSPNGLIVGKYELNIVSPKIDQMDIEFGPRNVEPAK
jgi:predicted nucleic acid-binding protein